MSAAKAGRAAGVLPCLDFISPNAAELVALADAVQPLSQHALSSRPTMAADCASASASTSEGDSPRQQIAKLCPALQLILQVMLCLEALPDARVAVSSEWYC